MINVITFHHSVYMFSLTWELNRGNINSSRVTFSTKKDGDRCITEEEKKPLIRGVVEVTSIIPKYCNTIHVMGERGTLLLKIKTMINIRQAKLKAIFSFSDNFHTF